MTKYQRDEIDEHDEQEERERGKAIAANAKAIFDIHGAATMYQLGRTLYKYIDCGPATQFELHDGSKVYYQSEAANAPEPWTMIRRLAVSSIVEGSDAEVEPIWIDLADEKYMDEGGAGLAVKDFNQNVADVNDEATALWHEANDENEAEAEAEYQKSLLAMG
jgi:hypothetical protein